MAYDRKREERREKREEEGANTTSQRGKDGVGNGDVIAMASVAADDDAEVVGPAPLSAPAMVGGGRKGNLPLVFSRIVVMMYLV